MTFALPPCWVNRYSRLGQRDQAISLLLPFETNNRNNLDQAWVLGSALINADHPADGRKRVQSVAEQRQSAEAYKLAAQADLQLTFLAETQRTVDEAIRLNPNLPRA
jgi:hypothetical protein